MPALCCAAKRGKSAADPQVLLLGAPVCPLHLLCLWLCSQQTCRQRINCLKTCLPSEAQKQETLQLAS